MGVPQRWFNNVRRKLRRLSPGDTVVLPSNASAGAAAAAADDAKSSEASEDVANYQRLSRESTWSSTNELTKEDMAATKIQSVFRGHLARQALRALRSLVKLQALVRGAYVRKQSRIALHCMHALVRLQVRVRARQLLSRCSDE